MKILFLSRKKKTDVGGLARFAYELTSRFPKSLLLSPNSTTTIFKLPFANIDLIHLCDATLLPLGILLKFFMRKPLTLTAHGRDLAFPNKVYQAMLKQLLPKVDAIVLDSHAAKALLIPLKIPANKVCVIPLGISIDHFANASPIHIPESKNKLVLLTVGNLIERKGHMWFIEHVLVRLPNTMLYLIVGDGPERRAIEQTIKKHNLTHRVFLFGRLPDDKLAFVLKRAHIYVCPNQKIEGDFEGFGIACGEAAYMSLPVVATNVDGIPEIIKHDKNGLLVNSTPQAFLSALDKLKNSQNREKLGKRAKIYTLRKYYWRKTVKEYQKVFEQLVGKT